MQSPTRPAGHGGSPQCQRPGWVLVNLDVENAHNALLRRVALERIYADPNTQHLLPVYWAHYSPKSRIYFRGTRREVVRAGFDSEEAWRQGCPLAVRSHSSASTWRSCPR